MSALLAKFDELMVQLADRLVSPNAGMMGMGKGGVPDAACLKRLANLGLAITQRGMLMEKGMKDAVYDTPEQYKEATDKINSVWTIMKTHAIEKGIAIDKAASLDPAKYKTTVATVKANPEVACIMHALEGLDALASSPDCTKHKRIDHFAKNVIGGKQGVMGLEKFKADAKAWIADYPKEEDVAAVVNQAAAANALRVISKAPMPPGAAASNARMKALRAQLNAARTGTNVASAPVNVAGLQARLNALKRGGSRKSRKSRKSRNRKTKRRHH